MYGVKECKRLHRRIQLPLLTNEAWLLVTAGIVGGITGAFIHYLIIEPFLLGK
jgi:hypothetical protein